MSSARRHTVTTEVLGPWSLKTSKAFWEGFAPSALAAGVAAGGERGDDGAELYAVFRVEGDWQRAEATVKQRGATAEISVTGPGDLDAAATQVLRFLSLDIDGREWVEVARRDPVIADAQQKLPGLRPCGFHSPYEAAAWSVLSQRIRITQASRLRTELIERYGDDGAFPAPEVLRSPHTQRALELALPGRKAEYLQAVADAAVDGLLDGSSLRALDPADAIARVQEVKGLGPFAAELVVIRGANAPDVLPRNESRLSAEVIELYGARSPGVDPAQLLDDVGERWRPFRSWAAVHLRALREERTHEIGGGRAGR